MKTQQRKEVVLSGSIEEYVEVPHVEQQREGRDNERARHMRMRGLEENWGWPGV